MLVAPAVAVLPLVLELALALRNVFPLARPVLPHRVLSPSRQLQLPDAILNTREQRHDSSDCIDSRQELEQTLVHEDVTRDADGAMADVLVRANDPVGGECKATSRHGLESGHSDDHDNWLEIRRDLCPVVAVDVHLGVDVKVHVGKGIRLERSTRFPNRDRVKDVETPRAQVREVVRTEVVNNSLNLVDRAAALRREQTIEARVFVDELSVCIKSISYGVNAQGSKTHCEDQGRYA